VRKRQNQAGTEGSLADLEKSAANERQFVTALHRGLEILRAFRTTDAGGLGNLELAQRTGLPTSTVSRLTYTLSSLGYLVYNDKTGRYRMGIPVLSLGYACLGGLRIRETAQAYMQDMAERCGDGVLVALGGRDGLSMTYVACARAPGIVSLQLDVGSRISLGRSAMGRAYLAGARQAERAVLMEHLRERAGEHDWARIEAGIEDAVAQVEAKGFYSNVGQWQREVNAVSVPFRPPHNDSPLLAFNAGGPAYLLPPERLERELGPLLVEVVNKVTRVGTA